MRLRAIRAKAQEEMRAKIAADAEKKKAAEAEGPQISETVKLEKGLSEKPTITTPKKTTPAPAPPQPSASETEYVRGEKVKEDYTLFVVGFAIIFFGLFLNYAF